MKKVFLVILFLFSMNMGLFAQEKTEPEFFYFSLGWKLGYGGHTIGSTSYTGFSAIGANVSIYKSIGDNMLIGPSFEITVATLSLKNEDGNDVGDSINAIRMLQFLLEYKYFFNRICKGLFLDGGIGAGWNDMVPAESSYDIESSELGFTFKLGGGYAFELTPFDSSFNVSAHIRMLYASYESTNWDSLMFTIDLSYLW